MVAGVISLNKCERFRNIKTAPAADLTTIIISIFTIFMKLCFLIISTIVQFYSGEFQWNIQNACYYL